jgi:hypothetical protein
MSTAREKTPFGASLLFGLSPLQFSESKEKTWRRAGTFMGHNGIERGT